MTTYGSQSGASTGPGHEDDEGGIRQQAVGATKDVAGTAREQAGQVADEASRQARDVLAELKGSLRQQTDSQRSRAVGGLRTLSDELWDMANRTEDPGKAADSQSTAGVAAELARQGSTRARELASYLEKNEPGDLLDDLRSFARRRPGTFLLGAAILGVAVGRLTRGAAAAAAQSSNGSEGGELSRPVSAAYDDAASRGSWSRGVGYESRTLGEPSAEPPVWEPEASTYPGAGLPRERDIP